MLPIDDWISDQKTATSRPEAIRRLVEIGLASASKGAKLDQRALKKASKVIDAMTADLKAKGK